MLLKFRKWCANCHPPPHTPNVILCETKPDMKKTATLLFTLFAGITLSAQWIPVYTDPAKIFDDAAFPTAQDGFVLGHYNSGNYFILKTTNGGLSWIQMGLPAGFFSQLEMSSATTGYLSRGGMPGVLVHTSDGFASTTTHNIDGSYGTVDLDLLNDSTGFYMNNDSHFRSFGQHGAAFSPVMDTLNAISYCDVADAATVYVGNGIHMEKTTDAGANWFCVNTALPEYAAQMAFVSADTGYYLGSSYGIWRTVDGGSSFQNVNTYYGYWIDAWGPFCASTNGLGTIEWSSNYGQSWVTESLGMSADNGVYIAPGGDCFVLNNMTGEIRKRQAPLSAATLVAHSPVTVFPNPANDVITVKIPAGANDVRFELTNTLGEKVLDREVPQDGRILLGDLPAGCYFYRVNAGDVLSGAGVVAKK